MKSKWVILFVVLLLAGAVSIYIVTRPGLQLEVIQPKVQTIHAYVDEQAITELPYDYLIAMPIAGWLQPIDLREGDKVQKDQIIARLETDDLLAEIRQIEQQIAVLETNIRETQDNRLENYALVQAIAT